MVEQEVPDYPTNFQLGLGCENRSAWKETPHVRGVAKKIDRVVGSWW